MSHLSAHTNPDPTAGPIPAPQHPGWLSISAGFTAAVPALADRADLTVIVEPGAAAPHPACYLIHQATIAIDGALLGTVIPSTVDPGDPQLRETYPIAWGALVHEAAHARHSKWDLTAGEAAATAAAVLLEESRVETAHLTRRPGDRRFLRAALTTLVLDDITGIDDPWTAATAAALICARVDAGVFDATEARPTRTTARRILTTARLTELRRIWRQAHRTADEDTAAMLELGRRWCHTLDLDPATTPTPATPPAGTSGQSSPTGRRRRGGTLRRAAQRSIGAAAAHDAADAANADHARQAAAAQAADRAAAAAHRATARSAAAAVFGTSPTSRPRPRTRPATPAERAAAGQLARALRTAAHREPVTTTTTAPTPPGRLRTRAALTAAAQRATGQPPTAQPWQRTTHRRIPQPPIHVGICADVSTSMDTYSPAVAAAAWITAQATAWAHGISATITFGEHITPITRPGQPPDRVHLFNPEPATDGLPTAIDALDHTLDLSNPNAGARLLVIASDGKLPDTDRPTAQTRLNRLAATGCALLWLAPPHSTPLTGAHIADLDTATDPHRHIAHAATTALSRYPTS